MRRSILLPALSVAVAVLFHGPRAVEGFARLALPSTGSSTTGRRGVAAGGDGKKQQCTQPLTSSRAMDKASSRISTTCSMTGGGAGGGGPKDDGKCSMTASVFNLVKNIMGAGMLSLPAGVATFSDSRSAIIPATGLIILMGVMSGYTFSLLGRSCDETNAESYEQSWAKTVSDKSAWLPAGACVSTCFAGCLAYTMIIGDTFSALSSTFGAPRFFTSRLNVILGMSSFVLLPLALLKNLSALGFTSMLGTGGLLYTAVMMGVRFFDGSYKPGGAFFSALSPAMLPVFDSKAANPLYFLVLVSMLGTAYEAHFNAPLFFKELKNNTVQRFNRLVSSSFLLSIATMSAVTAFGFLTFGANTSGFILNNYANSDFLATIARVLVGFSIVFSYPLCFVGFRDGILEMRGETAPSETKRTAWTVGLVALCSGLSCVLTDLGFVNSFFGALVASGIIYVFPSIMFLAPLRRKGMEKLSKAVRWEGRLNYGVLSVGLVLGVLGAIISVLESFFPAVLG